MAIRRSLLVLLLLAACVTAQSKKPEDAMRSWLRSCEGFGFSGSVLVARGGKVLLAEGFGLADRDREVRNGKDTLFEIASATKPFTAVAVLELENDRKLTCDDPIAKRLPGVPAGFEDVTIRHLLTHTSGMPRSAAIGTQGDLERAVAGYLAPGRARKPGAAYEYWNGGYALLAGIVERASGGTYMDFCRRRVFEPAGMKASGFTGDTHFDPKLVAIGYEGGDARPRRADEHPYETYGWQYRGMGGLVTTVEDFYRFDRALRDDTLLPEKARAKTLTPFLEGYACGFRVVDRPRRKVGHGGSVRGFHCQFSRFPNDDAFIVVLANCGGIPIAAIEGHLQSLLFGDPSTAPTLPPTVAWPREKADAIAGTYEASPDERIIARSTDVGIMLRAEGIETSQRLSVAPSEFHLPVDPGLVELSRTMLRKLSEGDVELLRERLGAGIPKSWPDRIRSDLWPERTAKLGKLGTVRPICAVAKKDATTIYLAGDLETGSIHVRVGFQGDRLRSFDLRGPEIHVDVFVQPAADTKLHRFAWTGAPCAPIAVLRDASGNPNGLRFDGPGTSPPYKRLTPK